MTQSRVSAHEPTIAGTGTAPIALLEDASRDLEDVSEEIMTEGHWPSWSYPELLDGLALCVGCWRSITVEQLGGERCPGTRRRPRRLVGS